MPTTQTRIKFTAVSPLTTQLLRARTEFLQRKGDIKIGRTVFSFFGTAADLDTLLDYLIMNEIPGAGANSKDVRRLRELRRWLRAALKTDPAPNEDDAAHVEITEPEAPAVDRDRLLDLLAELYEGGVEKDWGEIDDLNELASGPGFDQHLDRSAFRAWLAEVL